MRGGAGMDGGGSVLPSLLLLSIWGHRKWNFTSYSAAIALDKARQDKADSFLQICLSFGTIEHYTRPYSRAGFHGDPLEAFVQ